MGRALELIALEPEDLRNDLRDLRLEILCRLRMVNYLFVDGYKTVIPVGVIADEA